MSASIFFAQASLGLPYPEHSSPLQDDTEDDTLEADAESGPACSAAGADERFFSRAGTREERLRDERTIETLRPLGSGE